MDTEQLIQDYFSKKLSKEERLKVEQLVAKDDIFKAEFEAHKDLSIAFKISENQKLKNQLKNLEHKTSNESANGFNSRKYVYLAIASAIIIGFFYTTFRSPSGEELFNSNFQMYPNTYQPVTRSSQPNAVMSPFVAYENNDFLKAEKEFKTLLDLADNPNMRFYYASSLLNQSKFELALKQFEILNVLKHDYLSESLWYTALICIYKEESKKAIENLEKLNTLNSTFKSEERKVLLQKLNDL